MDGWREGFLMVGWKVAKNTLRKGEISQLGLYKASMKGEVEKRIS